MIFYDGTLVMNKLSLLKKQQQIYKLETHKFRTASVADMVEERWRNPAPAMSKALWK